MRFQLNSDLPHIECTINFLKEISHKQWSVVTTMLKTLYHFLTLLVLVALNLLSGTTLLLHVARTTSYVDTIGATITLKNEVRKYFGGVS